MEGLFWLLGDGKRVKIWGDKWVPQPTTFMTQSPCTILPIDAKVTKLIDPIGGGGMFH